MISLVMKNGKVIKAIGTIAPKWRKIKVTKLNFNKEVAKRFTPAEINKIREFTLSDSVDVVESLGRKLAEKVLKFYKEWNTNERNY